MESNNGIVFLDNGSDHVMDETLPDSALPQKPWLKRPHASIQKVSPVVKRQRRNMRFKKLVAPKNPLMVLNEIKAGLSFQVNESVDINNQPLFTATVEYEPGKVFSGQALSKKLAQQAAAEAALKGLFLHKLLERELKSETDDQVPESDQSSQTGISEDETPWCHLASFAFYKLIKLWESSDPVKIPASSGPQRAPWQAASTDEIRPLPEDPSSLDPVMLINQISPNSKFTETARDVRDGETHFTFSVRFKGQIFNGTAKKRKEAKKVCAREALSSIGVKYVKQE